MALLNLVEEQAFERAVEIFPLVIAVGVERGGGWSWTWVVVLWKSGHMPLPPPRAPSERIAGAVAGHAGCDSATGPMLAKATKSNGM